MKHQLKKSTAVMLLTILIVSACQQDQPITSQEPHALLGSWQMTSVHWITSDTTYSIHKSQPGIFIIDANRYATMWTPMAEPRTPFENLSQPTEDEMKAGFRSVVFNSGTYVMTDSTLITTAEIAKVPGFEGGKQFYRYSIEADTLELVMYDETYPDGTKPEWYGRYQTRFVYSRAE